MGAYVYGSQRGYFGIALLPFGNLGGLSRLSLVIPLYTYVCTFICWGEVHREKA
jgi:hypothetical protein